MKGLLTTALLVTGLSLATAQDIKVIVNGDVVAFDEDPVMRYGRVMVPLRGVFEHMGATVQYDPSDRKITAVKGDRTVELWARKAVGRINGIETVMDQAAMVVDGRTMVPLRFVSQALGAKVDWNADTKTVTIT